VIYSINLNWQTFNVDLSTVDTWIKAHAGINYCGLSANSSLQIHYSAPIDDATIDYVTAYWTGLSESSPEATNYQSEADRKAAAAAAKASLLASARTKLEALGLSADEITAIVGS